MIVARPVGQYDGIVSLKGGKGKDGSRWTNARKLVKKPHTHVRIQSERCGARHTTPTRTCSQMYTQAFMCTNRHMQAERRHAYPFAPHAPGTLTSTPNTATVCGRMNNLTSVRQRKWERGRRVRGRLFPARAHVVLWKVQSPRTDKTAFHCHLPTWQKTRVQSAIENNWIIQQWELCYPLIHVA